MVRPPNDSIWMEPRGAGPPDPERAVPPAGQGAHQLRAHLARPTVRPRATTAERPVQVRFYDAGPRRPRTRPAGRPAQSPPRFPVGTGRGLRLYGQPISFGS